MQDSIVNMEKMVIIQIYFLLGRKDIIGLVHGILMGLLKCTALSTLVAEFIGSRVTKDSLCALFVNNLLIS